MTSLHDLNWLADAPEERLPLSESSPVWVRQGVVRAENAPTILPHCHTNCEIGIWFKGEGYILGEAEKVFHRAGDLFLAGPGVSHASQITRYPVRFTTVHFSPSLLLDMGPDTDGLRALRRFTARQTLAQRAVRPPPRLRKQFTTMFGQIAQEWESRRVGREFRLRTLLLEQLVLLLRWEEEAGCQVGAEGMEVEWQPIARALAYLREHYADSIYSKEVAGVAGVSETRLKVLFREALGMTWVKYLQVYRIHRAAALMGGAHRNVTEAAFAVGFESLSHFNTVFQKCMGVSPKQWLQRTAKAGTATIPGTTKSARKAH
ncbi:MAG: helix-turn-helix domain-containing protein [Chthoniobacterales bacterium]|nr:helix-turn-helix domain-containing protein [Chthoniobacterales bacterium]